MRLLWPVLCAGLLRNNPRILCARSLVNAAEVDMNTLEGQRVVVTGGSRGLGLGMVEALVARGAEVTVVARKRGPLEEVHARLGVAIVQGDASEQAVADRVVAEVRPNVLLLMNAAMPALGSIATQTWESFSTAWNHDVKAGLHWLQAALRLPLPRASRVMLGSSGAAVQGSPLSGGYAGAKRMLWLMAKYAQALSVEQDLGIRFQALVPMQIIATTEHGRAAAEAYAAKRGVDLATFVAGFGQALSAREVGEHVVTMLTDPRYESAVALSIKGGDGITVLEG